MSDFGDFAPAAKPAAKPASAPSDDFAAFTQPKPKSKIGPALSVVGGTAVEAGKQTMGPYWESFKKASNQYINDIKEAANPKDDPRGPVAQVAQSAKLLWSVVGGLGDFLDVADPAIQPVKDAVQKLGDVIKPHVAPDTYDAQARREGQRRRQYPKGVDWKVHEQDVQAAVENVNLAFETAVKTRIGFVGAGGKGAVPKAELTPAEEARAQMVSTPHEEAHAAHLEEIRKRNWTSIYDKQKPTGLPAKPSEPDVIKPRMRMVGETPEGKPRVRLVAPEQARAEVAEAHKALNVGQILQPIPPKQVSEKLVKEHEQEIRQTIGLHKEWLAPHSGVAEMQLHSYLNNAPVSAHRVLDAMILNSGEKTYVKSFLQKLRAHVDDIPVSYVGEITDFWTGEVKHGGWSGMYNALAHKVQVRYDVGSPLRQTTDTAHELVHAATVRYILQTSPDNPLIKDLGALYDYVLNEPGALKHYGMQDLLEFTAEAMTKPTFQAFLLKSSRGVEGMTFEGSKTTPWHALGTIVQRILGIKNPMEAVLLHDAMRVTSGIMEQQAKDEMLVPRAEDFGVISKSEPVRQAASKIEQLTKVFNPEGLGKKAKMAAAVLANRLAERQWRTNGFQRGSRKALELWNQNEHLIPEFLEGLETGKTWHDNEFLQAMKSRYKVWARNIFERDTLWTGMRYSAVDNYMPHLFTDPEGVREFLNQKYGRKWGDPGFIRNRSFSTIKEAVDAGFTLKYKTPEEMMLARQMASDVAEARVNILRDLHRYGIAVEKQPGKPFKKPMGFTRVRSPNGQIYFVGNEVASVLHNAFDSYSLWRDESLIGDTFKKGMWLKNVIVPLHLALSGFHVFHVFGIDQAAGLARGFRGMLTGTRRATTSLDDLLKSKDITGIYSNPALGGRLIRAFDNPEAASQLTESEKQAVQYMLEGGFTPYMDPKYRNVLEERTLPQAWKDAAKHPWKLPVALNTTLRRPVFEIWIPRLKAASYIKETRQAIAADPTLLEDSIKRKMALRRVQKSVDNRYGEMAYDQLLWTRWVKDLMVLNTLSLGWQMGFIREYGGGMMDVGQFARRAARGEAMQALKEGQLDRPLFVTAYTGLSLGYNGLMNYAMSGQYPTGLDWIYPRTGEKNPDGTDQRVNTMWYIREFASIYKHMESQGVVSGLGHLAASKSSGFLGLLTEFFGGATGTRPVDSFGREFTNPDSPAYKRVAETLAHVLGELEPISIQNLEGQGLMEKARSVGEHPGKAALAVAGFTKAPKYATQTGVQNRIESDYHRFGGPAEKSFGDVLKSKDFAKLRQQYEAGDPDMSTTLQDIVQKYELSYRQVNDIMKEMAGGQSMHQYMFSKLPEDKQQALMNRMTPEELDEYRPHARKRLRQYEPGQ